VQDLAAKTIVLHIRKVGQILPFSFEYGFKNGKLLKAYKPGDTFDVAISESAKPDSLIRRGLKVDCEGAIKIFSKTVNGSQIVF
jgi:hypothetical protein